MTRVPPPWLAPAPKTARPDGEVGAVRPGDGGRAGRVDVDDREVAVAVPARDGPARATAVSERDGDFVAAQVVGIGQDLAVGDDDAGAAGPAADPDDGRSDALGDGGDGGLQVFDGAHRYVGSRFRGGRDRLVTCNLLLTASRDKPRPPTYHRTHGRARPQPRRVSPRGRPRARRRPVEPAHRRGAPRRAATVQRARRRRGRDRAQHPDGPAAPARTRTDPRRDAVPAAPAAHVLRPDRGRPRPGLGAPDARRLGLPQQSRPPSRPATGAAARRSRPAGSARPARSSWTARTRTKPGRCRQRRDVAAAGRAAVDPTIARPRLHSARWKTSAGNPGCRSSIGSRCARRRAPRSGRRPCPRASRASRPAPSRRSPRPRSSSTTSLLSVPVLISGAIAITALELGASLGQPARQAVRADRRAAARHHDGRRGRAHLAVGLGVDAGRPRQGPVPARLGGRQPRRAGRARRRVRPGHPRVTAAGRDGHRAARARPGRALDRPALGRRRPALARGVAQLLLALRGAAGRSAAVPDEDRDRLACPACGHIAYVNPAPGGHDVPDHGRRRDRAHPARHRARQGLVGAAGRLPRGRRDGPRGRHPRDPRGDGPARRAGPRSSGCTRGWRRPS